MSLLPRFMHSTIQVAQGAVGVGDHGIVAPDQNVLGAFPLGIIVAVGEELRVVADVEATSLQGRGEDAGRVACLAGEETRAVVGGAEVLRHEGSVPVDVSTGSLGDPDRLGAIGIDDLLHLAFDDFVCLVPADLGKRVLAAVLPVPLQRMAQTVGMVEHFLEGEAPRTQATLVVRVLGIALNLLQDAVFDVHENTAIVVASRSRARVRANDGVAVLLPCPLVSGRIVLSRLPERDALLFRQLVSHANPPEYEDALSTLLGLYGGDLGGYNPKRGLLMF